MAICKEKLLRPAVLKLERGLSHLHNLNAKITAYVASQPLRWTTWGNRKAGWERHLIEQTIPIPEDFGLIAGDAIHNLRSAFDILVFAMVGERAANPLNIQFPFASKEEALENTLKRRENAPSR